jgi:hypothetical protein
MPNYWRPYAQATLKIEAKFVPYVVGVIKAFREQFVADMQYKGKEYALSQLSLRTAHAELTPILQSIYKVAGLMGAKMTASEIKALVTQKDIHFISMHTKAAPFGRNLQWIQDVMNYLGKHLLKFVQNISDTMREDIVKILQRATDNHLSIADTISALEDEGLIKARAQVIVRTEVNRAGNVGHATAAQSLPYEVDKKWIGAADHRERHSHVLMNNRTIDEVGFYEVPVYENKVQIATDHMQFPGDPNAHVSNTANCRCRVIYLPKRDAQGRLIMREQSVAPVIPMRGSTVYTPAQIAAELKAHVVVTP